VTVNVYLLQWGCVPLERLVEEMESADLSRPAQEVEEVSGPEEVRRLQRTFRSMLARLEAERRQSGSAALDAQERERSRVARDLHDEVNQALTGLLLRIETLRREAPPELAEELAETGAVASRAMDELLTLARRLRPTMLDDLGLEAALASLVEEVDRGNEIQAAFESDGDLSTLPPETQLVAYRVAQEALTNAVQHGHAEHVRVRLNRTGEGLELRVADDGSGLDRELAAAGLGIAGMRERALLVGGRLEIDSEPGAGTRVRLRA
jgi:two-component system sensor histidine kinase UhpB